MKKVLIFCFGLMFVLAANAEIIIRNQSLGAHVDVYVVDCENGVAIIEASTDKDYAVALKVKIKWAGVTQEFNITVEPNKVASKKVVFFNKGYCGYTPVVTNITGHVI